MGGPRVGDKPIEIDIGEVQVAPPDAVKVGEDDTLQSIAELYHVGPKDLLAANKLTDPSEVYAGQVLKLPKQSYADPSATDAVADNALLRMPARFKTWQNAGVRQVL